MADQAREMEAMQKKLQDVQGKSTSGARESSLKRRDLKGQPLSQPQGGQEGLTPEQQQMYQQLMQQMEEIKENKKKHDAALDELMKGEGNRFPLPESRCRACPPENADPSHHGYETTSYRVIAGSAANGRRYCAYARSCCSSSSRRLPNKSQ